MNFLAMLLRSIASGPAYTGRTGAADILAARRMGSGACLLAAMIVGDDEVETWGLVKSNRARLCYFGMSRKLWLPDPV